MPQPPMSEVTKSRIREELLKGLSHEQIARKLKVSTGSVAKVKQAILPDLAAKKAVSADDVKRLLRKGPLGASEIAGALGCTEKAVRSLVSGMRKTGAFVMETIDGRYDLTSSDNLETRVHEIKGHRGDWTHHFGFVTDNHLCNKHSRLDVLRAAYEHFAEVGIKTVFNAGNWIDGEARFNKSELVTAPGMDKQLDYMIDNYPVRPGITTHYIAGDDHEGWYQQREGIEVGHYLQMRAEEQGRKDLRYLGYAEADIRLRFGTGEAVMRLVHPGGGSAYAISYTDQKRAESYQGGEKPHIELVGHYHKFNHGYPREIHTLQGGCTCDQTMFMRKKRLQAHVGFSTVKIKQDINGAVERFVVEWFPHFDRGYYEKRF
ncbi:hypothetical protein [Silvibacterium acidisoli]|uniref:hypothetical protein n=1 Tax=Acidobacteriaceae bacterium ZG23-2 TaxID=2883246 RepID=UPI00406CEA7F